MPNNHDPLVIAGKEYSSRLLTGTGKYKDLEETQLATEAAGAEIVTVAIRRSNIGQNPDEPSLLEILPPEKYTILPNTAGCYTAEDAVRTCKLARELLRREMESWHSLGKLIDSAALQLIHERREDLRRLTPAELELLFRSATPLPLALRPGPMYT